MSIPSFRDFEASDWWTFGIHTALFAFLAALLAWKIGSLPGDYAIAELQAQQSGLSLKAISEYPLNAPFHLVMRGLEYLDANTLLATRILSATVGAATILTFYLLVRHWHGSRTAGFSTLVFGSSALFLHTARLGTPEVLTFLFFILVACGFWLKQTGSSWALILSFLLIITLLYVPGMIGLLVLGAIWQWKALDKAFKKHLGIVTAGGLMVAAAIAPLGIAMYKNHSLIKEWVGLPLHGWPNPITVLKNFLEVPIRLFIHNDADPVRWLGTAPILEVFGITMLVIGAFLYWRHISLSRAKLFIALALAMSVLVAFGGPVTISIMLPFLYLVIAAGIQHMLHEWFTVFPRNPIAQGIGVFVLSAVLALSVAYHVRHYFVAWPSATATRQAFTAEDFK